ncbi:hypothetical protein Tco_0189112 [Tanacetum coccineum]
MATLADKAIRSGADNRSPMLEKDMYDSWKSIMELYMLNRQHGRMILESVENGPLIWPSIEENRVTRPKKYSKLSATEVVQADCDIKATNIILHGLPPEVYALVSNHKVAKERWERIQLLMQRTSLIKQEREFNQQHEVSQSDSDLIVPVFQKGNDASVQNSNTSAQLDALILSVIKQLKSQVITCTKINLDNKSVNDTLTAELERFKEQVKVLKEGQNYDLKSKDNISDSCEQSVKIDHLKQTLSEHLKEKES